MFNELKHKIKSFKKSVECISTTQKYAQKIVRERKLFAELDHNIKVYLSDDYVGTVSGDLTQATAFAIPSEREIYINTAMLKLPRIYANAIIAHEIGHIVLNHKPGASYLADNRACKGPGFVIELEADKYAQDRGFDMIGALNYLYCNGYRDKTVRTRLAALALAKFGK